MNKVIKIGLVLFLTMLLILIRFFESNLFYDPLYLYFKSDYSNLPISEIETLRFAGNITLRYVMNTTISLVILWVLFKSRSIIKLSSILYFVFFIILLSIFCFLLFYFILCVVVVSMFSRAEIQEELKEDEVALSLTAFPL